MRAVRRVRPRRLLDVGVVGAFAWMAISSCGGLGEPETGGASTDTSSAQAARVGVPSSLWNRLTHISLRTDHPDPPLVVITHHTLGLEPEKPCLRQECLVWPEDDLYGDPLCVTFGEVPLSCEPSAISGTPSPDTLLVAGLLGDGTTVVDRIDFTPPRIVRGATSDEPEGVVPPRVASTRRLLSTDDRDMAIASGFHEFPPDPDSVVVQFEETGSLYTLSLTQRDRFALWATASAADAAATGAFHEPGLAQYRFDQKGGSHVSGADYYASFVAESWSEHLDSLGYSSTGDWDPAWEGVVYGVILVDEDQDGVLDFSLDASGVTLDRLRWSSQSAWKHED